MGHSSSAATDYIDSLLKEIKAATTETDQEKKEQNLKALTSRFPRGGLLGILEKNPDLLPKCMHLTLFPNNFASELRAFVAFYRPRTSGSFPERRDDCSNEHYVVLLHEHRNGVGS